MHVTTLKFERARDHEAIPKAWFNLGSLYSTLGYLCRSENSVPNIPSSYSCHGCSTEHYSYDILTLVYASYALKLLFSNIRHPRTLMNIRFIVGVLTSTYGHRLGFWCGTLLLACYWNSNTTPSLCLFLYLITRLVLIWSICNQLIYHQWKVLPVASSGLKIERTADALPAGCYGNLNILK